MSALSRTVLSACMLAAASGCTVSRNVVRLDPGCTTQPCYDANYVETCYTAMHYLLANARPAIVGEDAFDTTRPVLWATTVDLNNYGQTTHFGRLIGETLSIALQNHRKNKLIHMTVSQGSVPINASGEFFLTRDVSDLAAHFNAGAALVSSYSVSIDRVYVQVQLVNLDQNAVVGAVQFAIPHGPRTMALLRNERFPSEASSLTYNTPVADRRSAY